MKTKTLFMLALSLALILASSAPTAAIAKGAVVPFKATYDMSPRIVGVDANGCNIQELPGVGQATHLGESTFYSDAAACPRTLTQSGDMEFTAANGDRLFGYFSGSIAFTQPGIADFWGTYSITSGTGRFEGVTGTGIYWGSAQLAPGGKGILYFDGTLNK
jgi:hypothetical protein